MPKNDGDVVFQIRADSQQLESDLKSAAAKVKNKSKTISKPIDAESAATSANVKRDAARAAGAVDDIGDAAQGAGRHIDGIDGGAIDDVASAAAPAAAEVNNLGDAAESADKKFSDLGKSAASAGAEIAKGLGGAAVKGTAAVTAAVGSAAIAVGSFATNSAVNMDQALNSLAASTGASSDEMTRYEGVLKAVYKNNFGENFQDISDGIALITKNLGDMDYADLQNVTESAFALRDVFEYDVAESTRAAKAMMDNFGISGNDAMSLIAAGAQNGLDYSGELIDSISEYSIQFAKMGLNADDMFNIFSAGAENGAWNLDKIGDAVKEMSIRVIDGSDTTIAGFESIGLNADEMAKKFAEGGETAKQAFSDTLTALSEMDDPIAQDAAGVALLGTMWEDLGADAVASLADISGAAYDTGDAMNSIKSVKYNDLASMFDGLTRAAELLVLPLGEQLIPVFLNIIDEILPALEDELPGLIECFEQFITPILELGSDALPALIDVFSELSENIFPILTDTLLPALISGWDALAPALNLLISELLPPLMGLFAEIIPIVAELAAELIPVLVDVFNALMPVIMQLISAILPPLAELLSALCPLIESLLPVITFLADVLATVLGVWVAKICEQFEFFIGILTDVIDFISYVFLDKWKKNWDAIVDFFGNAFNKIPEIAENVINGAIGVINSIINGINGVTGTVGIDAIPTISDVSLPKFHTGGIVDFAGKYESPIMAKNGEMVLTGEQQRRLFAIANGDYGFPAGASQSQVINNYYNTATEITNNNEFSVRDDSDIETISQELANLAGRESDGRGG